jgi:hypothetical protein
MRIAYVNTDEVNQDLAERTASEYCAAVCILVPEGPPPDGLFDAVLYNLDEVPRDQRSALLERLRQATPHRPTAVHGYDITDEQARTLRRHGVAVAQRLHPALLRSLCKAALRSHATVPSDGALTVLIWVNLAK